MPTLSLHQNQGLRNKALGNSRCRWDLHMPAWQHGTGRQRGAAWGGAGLQGSPVFEPRGQVWHDSGQSYGHCFQSSCSNLGCPSRAPPAIKKRGVPKFEAPFL